MADCGVCNKAVNARKYNSISCSVCNKPCHAACAKMTKQEIESLVKENQTWQCPACCKPRSQSESSDGSVADEGRGDLSQVISMLEEAKQDRKRIENEMNRAFNFVHEEVADQKKAFEEQAKKLDQLTKLIEGLQEENKMLKKKVELLEHRVEESEQYSRSNTLEIQGVPESPGEDTYDVVAKVGEALDMTVTRDMIDVCHRLGKREGSTRPAGIIVKFVRREVKQIMLQKRRDKRRNFTTSHIGYEHSSSPVFINESLTPYKRKLLQAAQAVKRDKDYKFVWVRNGKIFVRKEEQSRVITISSMDDVVAL